MSATAAAVHTTYDAAPSAYRDEMALSFPGADARPAIEWFRDVIEGAPAWLRYGLPPGWRVLGMKLASTHAPDHVHGWPVISETPQRVVLAAPSRLGFQARLAVDVDADGVRFTTLIDHSGRVSRPLWSMIGAPHRALIAHMMRHAAR